MVDGLLIIYGEIALRRDNRKIFEDKLLSQIKNRIAGLPGYYLKKDQGRFLILSEGEFDYDTILPLVSSVFGLVGVCPCSVVSDDNIENLKEKALLHMQRFSSSERFTFKVEARRAQKSYPMTSQQIAAEIGGHIDDCMENSVVDLHKPEVVLRVEVRTKTYIFSKSIKCLGGLPAGTTGRGVLMLSGGIDSPVAGFLAAKRGVALSAVFFDSPPYTSERATEKVKDLARRLAFYTGDVRLYIVPFTDTMVMLNDRVPIVKLTIFLKRAMIRAAQLIAEKEKAQGIIMGDAIGQVASQTMHSIAAVNSAAKLPLIRPLAGMDKQEVVDLAVKIDTYNISIRPYDDCCTVFVAKNPETKPKTSVIESMESRITNLDEYIEKAVENAEIIEYRG